MSKSSLATVSVPASSSNYTQGRKGYKICKFTPHHMAGNLTVEQCGNIFKNAGRGASSNYGIGTDGRIACYVEEENRAWTSSNGTNDCQAITVEVANSSTGGDWPISDAAWKSLVNLAVDVCRRYGFRLTFDGTPNGSLTYHSMFTATSCPGPYLKARMNQLAAEVNAILDGGNSAPAAPQPAPAAPSDAYTVKVTATGLNIRTGAGTSNPVVGCITDKGVYTIVETQGNWGKLKSGAGWICLDYTQKVSGSAPAAPAKKSVDEIAKEVIAGKWGNGADRKTKLQNAGYNYTEVQNRVNALLK